MLAGIGLAALSGDVSAEDDKLKPEELVARHLASIGSAEARKGVKTRIVAGATTFILRLGGSGTESGPGNILSDARRLRIGLKYPSNEYAGEQLAFDGNRVSVGLNRPGDRSELAQFVYHHEVMMKEGLLGGVLNAAWGLLDTGDRKPKLTYAGLTKMEGKPLHEIHYRPRRGASDLQISLFFEPETFRHVMTQYRLEVPSGMPSVPGQTPPRNSFHTLLEYFGDFREVDGLTLPHSYRFGYTIEGLNSTYLAQWAFQDIKIAHNAPMEDRYFLIQ